MADGNVLHYANQSVSHCNHPNTGDYEQVVRWQKNVSLRMETSGAAMQDFILKGNSENLLNLYIRDNPPSALDVTLRQCVAGFVQCQDCLYETTFDKRSCAYVEPKEITTNNNKSITTLVPEMFKPSVTNVVTNHDKENESSHGISPTAFSLADNARACKIWYQRKIPFQRHASVYSILFTVGSVDDMTIVSQNDHGSGWETISCLKGANVERNASCEMSASCLYGYMNFDPWTCLEPDSLSLRIHSSPLNRVNVLRKIVEENIAGLSTVNFIYDKEIQTSGTEVITKWAFSSYPFKEEGTSDFALADSLTSKLKSMYGGPHMFLQQDNITICAIFIDRQKCQHILVNGKFPSNARDVSEGSTPKPDGKSTSTRFIVILSTSTPRKTDETTVRGKAQQQQEEQQTEIIAESGISSPHRRPCLAFLINVFVCFAVCCLTFSC